MHMAILHVVSYHSEFQYKCYNLGGVRKDTLLQRSIKLRKTFKKPECYFIRVQVLRSMG